MISYGRRLGQTLCGWLLVGLVLGSGSANAQSQAAPSFKPEEIEALVAPIALYPDSVLSQVLMASTYPLEVVQAARWVKANPKVKGDAAVKAVGDQPWDVSVKSLVAFPQILEPMNDKLDWTQKLGDAFLAQESDVLAAVQRLRGRAQQSGNLKSNEQQTVTTETATVAGQPGQTIVKIEPANPEVIYVPAYNPTVVYGSWGYPAYPPTYWPPYPAYYPGAALATGFAWGVGLAAAGAIFGSANWGGGDVNINVNRAANIDRNFDRTKVQGGKWQHDASHRKGVSYRDNASREKFGRSVPGADARNNFRGRGEAGRSEGLADRGSAGNRAGVADRAGDRGGERGGFSDRGGERGGTGMSDRAGAAGDRGGAGAAARDNRSQVANRGSAGGRDNAFQGVGGGGASQRDFDRGRSSVQSSLAGRGGGGGFSGGGRGGGGRAGGGGRGGGGRR
ncbi:DUF3300 domain-containing protein [Cupriavidus pinatubonensis]|uniref:DUF3300 domain-containing protein n=1 Tax=Cupriavidus pinatubonensis TaxID=248026 RepID=A0ABM8XU95_9BURK|nr:DUF3300 domain-containing protein [Cupriavidus pinatubonensis]CAG9183933.1 hypothetical protein LMG23994_05267 [Cupriavidus pinatubonensis]